MKYGYLGKSGLRVSRLCLGTAAFGGKVGKEGEYGSISEQEAFRIMDAALDAGINFFDTANVYGGVRLRGETIGHRGITEEIIGRWFAQGGNRRERVVLGTKVGRVFEEDELDGPNKAQGLSLYKIRRHFEASLKGCKLITSSCIKCITWIGMCNGRSCGRRSKALSGQERSIISAPPILPEEIWHVLNRSPRNGILWA